MELEYPEDMYVNSVNDNIELHNYNEEWKFNTWKYDKRKNILTNFPELKKGGFIRSWAGLSFKLYRDRCICQINEDFTETQVCTVEGVFYCNYYTCGIFLLCNHKFIAVDMFTLKYYDDPDLPFDLYNVL